MQQDLEDILDDIKSVEPLPQVATQVMRLASQEDVIPRELVAVIQTDAGVTAKVLKLCNSALYGFQREIASLAEAGNLLGVSTLVNLVLTSCAGRYFRNYGPGTGPSAKALWEDSVSTALATSMLAGLQGKVDKNRAYTVGLLENVGRLVMLRYLPGKQDELDEELRGGASSLEAEEAVIGLNHAEIGARLAERWLFPEVLVDSIRNHHTPDEAQVDPLLAAFGHLGEIFTRAVGLGEGLDPLAYELRDSALGLCGIGREGFESLESALKAEIQKAKGIVNLA